MLGGFDVLEFGVVYDFVELCVDELVDVGDVEVE